MHGGKRSKQHRLVPEEYQELLQIEEIGRTLLFWASEVFLTWSGFVSGVFVHHYYDMTDPMDLVWLHGDNHHRRLSCVLIYVYAIVTIRKLFPFSHVATNILRH